MHRMRAPKASRACWNSANAAVSTSGDSSQNLEAGGVRYSHIVDPATGMGLTVPVAVSVVARRGIDADSWSTALSVLGPERGMALIEKHAGLAALFTIGRDASIRTVPSPGWPGYTYPTKPKLSPGSQHPY